MKRPGPTLSGAHQEIDDDDRDIGLEIRGAADEVGNLVDGHPPEVLYLPVLRNSQTVLTGIFISDPYRQACACSHSHRHITRPGGSRERMHASMRSISIGYRPFACTVTVSMGPLNDRSAHKEHLWVTQ